MSGPFRVESCAGEYRILAPNGAVVEFLSQQWADERSAYQLASKYNQAWAAAGGPEMVEALRRLLAVGWIDASACQARANVRTGKASSTDNELVVATEFARTALKKAGATL